MEIISQQQQMFLPILVQATTETNIDNQHAKLLQAFKKIDIKDDELTVAKKSVIVKNEFITKEINGKICKSKEPVPVIVYSTNINYLIKKLGYKQVTDIIKVLLVNFNQYFNVKMGLTVPQIREITEQIIEQCAETLSLDELVYMLKKAKTSLKLYEKLDGPIIFGIIDEHYIKRNNQRHKNHEVEKWKDNMPTLVDDLANKLKVPLTDDSKEMQRYRDRDMVNSGISLSNTLKNYQKPQYKSPLSIEVKENDKETKIIIKEKDNKKKSKK